MNTVAEKCMKKRTSDSRFTLGGNWREIMDEREERVSEDRQNICYHENGRRRGKGSSQKRTLPLFRKLHRIQSTQYVSAGLRGIRNSRLSAGLRGMQKKRISTRDFRGCRRRGYRRGTSVVAEEEDIDAGLPRLQKKTSTWDFRGCRRRYRRGTSRMQKKRIPTLLDFVEFQRNYLFINRDIILFAYNVR